MNIQTRFTQLVKSEEDWNNSSKILLNGQIGIDKTNNYCKIGNGKSFYKDLPLATIKGQRGSQGPQGPQGQDGDVGNIGPQGIQGDKGDTGPQGVKGITGPRGNQGPQGIPGINGIPALTNLDSVYSFNRATGWIVFAKTANLVTATWNLHPDDGIATATAIIPYGFRPVWGEVYGGSSLGGLVVFKNDGQIIIYHDIWGDIHGSAIYYSY